jgi:hypothetical protein
VAAEDVVSWGGAAICWWRGLGVAEGQPAGRKGDGVQELVGWCHVRVLAAVIWLLQAMALVQAADEHSSGWLPGCGVWCCSSLAVLAVLGVVMHGHCAA